MNHKLIQVVKILIGCILCMAIAYAGYTQSKNQIVPIGSINSTDTLRNVQIAGSADNEINILAYWAQRFNQLLLNSSPHNKNLGYVATAGTLLLSVVTVLFLLSYLIIKNRRLYEELHSNKIALQEKSALLDNLKKDDNIKSLEMTGLRNQMNLHFLFNSLNSINLFILKNDTAAASSYLTKFSKLIRMVLENSQQSLISLGEDVKCLELYMQMEQFLSKNAFQYQITYPDGLNKEEIMVPPSLLQPFVENAIWHGIAPKGSGGKIDIAFVQKEEGFYCIIRDNGVGIKKGLELKSLVPGTHKSLGLQITKARLAMLGHHHDESLVEMKDLGKEDASEGGTEVTIKLNTLSWKDENSFPLY